MSTRLGYVEQGSVTSAFHCHDRICFETLWCDQMKPVPNFV